MVEESEAGLHITMFVYLIRFIKCLLCDTSIIDINVCVIIGERGDGVGARC